VAAGAAADVTALSEAMAWAAVIVEVGAAVATAASGDGKRRGDVCMYVCM